MVAVVAGRDEAELVASGELAFGRLSDAARDVVLGASR